MWQDALNGSFQDAVRLVYNKLVRNGRWCVPTSLVHRLVAEYHDAFHLTTSSVEKHFKEIHHGVEGEGLYRAVELQCQTWPSCAIHTHDTKRKQWYMTPMPIPMEPMDSKCLMCLTTTPHAMMGKSMTKCSYVFAGFPATSSQSRILNSVMKTGMKG